MIARIAWAALCAVLAFVTLQLQLDRQSARDPAYAGLVLEPFRANVQFIRAARALYRQETEAALAEARTLITRRPVPAEHLTLLAGAYYQDEDIEAASLAVQYAAQRGWRDPIAQEARLRLALEAGDEAEAARRLVALMLTPGTDTAALRELGQDIFAGPPGEAEAVLVELVSDTDRWHAFMLRRGVEVIPPQAFTSMVAKSLARGARFDCAALERAATAIERADAASGESLRGAIAERC